MVDMDFTPDDFKKEMDKLPAEGAEADAQRLVERLAASPNQPSKPVANALLQIYAQLDGGASEGNG
jgi:hypothetical protein